MTERQAYQPVPRIPMEQLKSLLDSGANVQVLDVRTEGAYQSSPVKIPGAIRISPDDLSAAASLPHDRLTVTYCT